jgi:hypothetical protein
MHAVTASIARKNVNMACETCCEGPATHALHRDGSGGRATADIWPHALLFFCLLLLLQLFAGLHHGVPGSNKLPEWPPAGSIGSLGMGMGMSPGHMMMFGTPPLGRSVDMVDVCTQLMEAGGECRGFFYHLSASYLLKNVCVLLCFGCAYHG